MRPSFSKMSKVKTVLAVLLVGVLAALVFLLSLVIFIPTDLIEDLMLDEAESRGELALSIDGLEKTFLPPGLRATRVGVKDGTGSDIFYIDGVGMRPSLAGLLSGRFRLEVDGILGRGEVHGEATINRRSISMNLALKEIPLKLIPFLRPYGIGEGHLDINAVLVTENSKCISGSVEMKGRGIDIDGVWYMGIRLPVQSVDDVGGDIKFADAAGGCRVVIDDLWAENDRLSAKITGDIDIRTPLHASPLDLKLEVTVRKRSEDLKAIQIFLAPYKRSENFFSIPLKGTVGRPIIKRGTLGLLKNPGFSLFQATGARPKGFSRQRPDNRL